MATTVKKHLICSSGSREGLEEMINKFYYSKNWFINDDHRAENKKTGSITGEITNKKNRWKFHL